METNNPQTAPIITVVHSGITDLNEDNDNDIRIVVEGDNVRIVNDEKSVEDNRSTTTATKEQEKDEEDKNVQDDEDSVIMEEVVTKTIDVDEESHEEIELAIEEENGETANDSFTKATEFVIVNAANASRIDVGDEAESPKRYAIEDIQIKDELAEAITADLNSNDVLENDPMDLLELNNRSECTSTTRSHQDTEDYGDDGSSITSSSAQTSSISTQSVLDWIKEYPWLLYEESDEMIGYCLYCDTKINVKSQRTVKQHGLSLYHKERCENYLAFREEEEKNGLSMKIIEIKEEFGTDSRVQALKLKRKSQSVALNNFNWRRWLEDYPWLERDSSEGTIGYCKYCQMHVNVEFSYLRDRHQESGKHKECEKQYEDTNETTNEPTKSSKPSEDKTKDTSIDNSKKWLELLENEPGMVRCKVCETKMIRNNFSRHLRTNLHEHNEKIYLQKQKAAKQKKVEDETEKNQNWKLYTKQHPWLVSDPSDSAFAYCKYCEKRIMYGSSAAKRATHENSSQHKQKESEFKKRSRKGNSDKEQNENKSKNAEQEGEDNQNENDAEDEYEEEDQESNEGKTDDNEENEEEAEDEDDEETNEDDNEETENEEEEEEEEEEGEKEKETDDNDSKKRIYKLSEEWINQYPWCKRYNKDPKHFIFCIYCRTPLSVTYSRTKHQMSSYHIASEKQYLERQSKKQERKQPKETSTLYEWAIPLRNNPNSYSCRYCRVRISKNYSKKQHASSKIHQINENIYKNRRKSTRKDDSATPETRKVVTQLANLAPTRKVQTFSKVVIKAPSTVTLVKQWQKKFPWLTYKRSELRSNYGYCKLCDSSLFIRSLKHLLRHLRSSRHIAVTKGKKKQKVEKDVDENENNDVKTNPKQELQTSPKPADTSTSQNQTKTTTETGEEQTEESAKIINYKSTVTEMKKRFSWIETSERLNYVSCRFCNITVPLKVLFLRNHTNSHKHRHSVVNYRSTDRKRSNRDMQQQHTESESTADVIKRRSERGVDNNDEDDVMIVEENNEEILISEQDENWTVKSETMDEHEELDYLLQRSFNSQNQNKSNVRNARKSINTEEDPPPKRVKRSQSFRRFNDSNTSLVASLLSAPLTLASCLGPLIQQQIQQQANISQTSQTSINPATATATGGTATAAVEPENTYDLFFKSISETMKKLPADLAAEGKLRVMQIICDLELQALKRQQQSPHNESSSNNTSGGLSFQPTSTSTTAGAQAAGSNSSVVQDMTAEHSMNGNETIITQLNTQEAELSPQQVQQQRPPSTSQSIPASTVNTITREKPNNSSTVIGVMDKNGLQTLQLKTPVAKQIPRSIQTNNTSNTTTTTASVNTGIRCIPFKNLSQTVSSDTTANTRLTRIQVPLNVATQSANQNPTNVNSSKNLVNYRNLQITKRINTTQAVSPATSNSSGSIKQQQQPQQTASHTTAIVNNKSPQRTYNITNIQPQLQRWGCSVNSSGSHQTPTSSGANNMKQLSAQQTSTPISKRN